MSGTSSEVSKSQIKMPKFSELSAGEGASICVQFAVNDNIKDSLLISSHVEAPPRLFFAEGLDF